MDKWYPEAIAAQELEEAKRIATPRIKYATEPVFARGSTGIQSTSFYSKSLQNCASFIFANLHRQREVGHQQQA